MTIVTVSQLTVIVTISWLKMDWETGKEYQGKIDWDFVKDFECQCEDFTFNLVGQGEPPDVCA